jgi:hypothetical protein
MRQASLSELDEINYNNDVISQQQQQQQQQQPFQPDSNLRQFDDLYGKVKGIY